MRTIELTEEEWEFLRFVMTLVVATCDLNDDDVEVYRSLSYKVEPDEDD